MKCPFCAEEIQAEAILCRFCGALKADGAWKPPERTPGGAGKPDRKGNLTIRIAGAFFLASAIWELYGLTGEVPLLGAVRAGWIAVTYHAAYVALFAAMGVGLLMLRLWGYRAVIAGTIVYTLDRAIYLLDRKTMEVYWTGQLEGNREILDLLDMDSIVQLTMVFGLLSLACWWGFAAYLHFRRDNLRR